MLFSTLSACSDNTTETTNDKVVKVRYVSSNYIITNPERGFYHQTTSYSEQEGATLAYLKNLKNQNISLILSLFYFDKFKETPLSQKQLDLIESSFKNLREAGVKCVLRFAYTDTMEGVKAGDAPIEIVETHINQLKPILQKNSDVIAFLQAGFIGAWGEWHASTNNLTTLENKTRIVNKLLDALPNNIMIQLRTPAVKQEIFATKNPVEKSIAFTSEKRARVGHHNDCFLASDDDYGTYKNPTLEKRYINEESLFVPVGGETCPPSGIPMSDCIKATAEMEYLRWTYLHADYYRPVLNNWNSQGCLDEIKKRLGYRFELMEGTFPIEQKMSEPFKLSLKLINKGFAPIYRNKIVSLILRSKETGKLLEYKLSIDIRECRPNGFMEIEKAINLQGISAGVYNMYLKISDDAPALVDRPEYSIQLANENTWIAETGMNNLLHDLKIIK